MTARNVGDEGTPRDRMTGGELQTIREYLGLTVEILAAELGVHPDTVCSWESGRDPVTERARSAVLGLEHQTASAVDDLVAELQDAEPRRVAVYRTTEEMAADLPDVARLGARWWRHVVARAAHEVPFVVIGTRAELDRA